MLRTIIWYAHFAGSLIWKIPPVGRLRKLKKQLPKEEFSLLIENFVAKWAVKHIKYSGAKIIVKGEENIPKDGAVLFVSNHQSNFDLAVFLGCIHKPKGYIAKIEVLKIPVLKAYMEFMQCIFMDRSDFKKSAKAILDGVDILKGGQSLVIFPEGTRSKGGPVGEFKAGSFKLATKSKVPIIPVTIDGSYKIMEANKNWIKPGTIYVTIHEKIETAGLTKEQEAMLPDITRQTIISALSAKKQEDTQCS